MELCSIVRAAALLRSGGLVAHATEGVWGLACDPFAAAAVQRLIDLKQRGLDKGLIVIGADRDAFAPELATLSDSERQRIENSWPGPVSWVLPTQRFSALVTGGRPSVAVRVPGHEQARTLCQLAGGLLVSTSANLSGQASATTQAQAQAAVGRWIDGLLPGEVGGHSGASRLQTLCGTVLRDGDVQRRP